MTTDKFNLSPGDRITLLADEEDGEPEWQVTVDSVDGEWVTYINPDPVCDCCCPYQTTHRDFIRPIRH